MHSSAQKHCDFFVWETLFKYFYSTGQEELRRHYCLALNSENEPHIIGGMRHVRKETTLFVKKVNLFSHCIHMLYRTIFDDDVIGMPPPKHESQLCKLASERVFIAFEFFYNFG